MVRSYAYKETHVYSQDNKSQCDSVMCAIFKQAVSITSYEWQAEVPVPLSEYGCFPRHTQHIVTGLLKETAVARQRPGKHVMIPGPLPGNGRRNNWGRCWKPRFLCGPCRSYIRRINRVQVAGKGQQQNYWTEAVQVTNTDDRPDLSSEGAPDIDKTVNFKQKLISGHETQMGLGTKTEWPTDRRS
jgi:hypothetical protein